MLSICWCFISIIALQSILAYLQRQCLNVETEHFQRHLFNKLSFLHLRFWFCATKNIINILENNRENAIRIIYNILLNCISTLTFF